MTLREALLQRRESIHQAWLDDTLATYPADSARFFKRERDKFANPVGNTYAVHTRAIADAIIDGAEPETVAADLEKVIKIRSIQEMSASQAVGFVFRLKTIIRDELAELREPDAHADLDELEQAIDSLALVAFDVYAQCREQLFDIRVNEVKRTVSGLMRRLNRIDDAETETRN